MYVDPKSVASSEIRAPAIDFEMPWSSPTFPGSMIRCRGPWSCSSGTKSIVAIMCLPSLLVFAHPPGTNASLLPVCTGTGQKEMLVRCLSLCCSVSSNPLIDVQLSAVLISSRITSTCMLSTVVLAPAAMNFSAASTQSSSDFPRSVWGLMRILSLSRFAWASRRSFSPAPAISSVASWLPPLLCLILAYCPLIKSSAPWMKSS